MSDGVRKGFQLLVSISKLLSLLRHAALQVYIQGIDLLFCSPALPHFIHQLPVSCFRLPSPVARDQRENNRRSQQDSEKEDYQHAHCSHREVQVDRAQVEDVRFFRRSRIWARLPNSRHVTQDG